MCNDATVVWLDATSSIHKSGTGTGPTLLFAITLLWCLLLHCWLTCSSVDFSDNILLHQRRQDSIGKEAITREGGVQERAEQNGLIYHIDHIF